MPSLTGLEKKSRVTTEKSAAVSAKPLVATRDSARRDFRQLRGVRNVRRTRAGAVCECGCAGSYAVCGCGCKFAGAQCTKSPTTARITTHYL